MKTSNAIIIAIAIVIAGLIITMAINPEVGLAAFELAFVSLFALGILYGIIVVIVLIWDRFF